MAITWKIKYSIDVVSVALDHHINKIDFQYQHRPISFVLAQASDALEIYEINFNDPYEKWTHRYGDNLANIKLRKLNEELTEITIDDAYWLSNYKDKHSLYSYLRSISFAGNLEDTDLEKRISLRNTLREKILNEIKARFEEDGFFDEKPETPQTRNNITIIGNVNDSNINMGNKNDIDT